MSCNSILIYNTYVTVNSHVHIYIYIWFVPMQSMNHHPLDQVGCLGDLSDTETEAPGRSIAAPLAAAFFTLPTNCYGTVGVPTFPKNNCRLIGWFILVLAVLSCLDTTF